MNINKVFIVIGLLIALVSGCTPAPPRAVPPASAVPVPVSPTTSVPEKTEPLPSPSQTVEVIPSLTPTPAATPEQTPVPTVSAPPPLPAPSSNPLPAFATLPQPDPGLAKLALDLINKDRTDNGLAPVVLGNNAASQLHAQEMLAKNYIGHWDLDGLKPYMRYTMAGGVNYEMENLYASSITGGASMAKDPKALLGEAEIRLMGSPGHRAAILTEWHKKVSLGIAYNSENLALVQQFEGDYIAFNDLPVLKNGILELSGKTTGDLEVTQIQIWFDRTPHALTLGQIGKTFEYWRGEPAAFIRPPPPAGAYYNETEAQFPWETVVDPYDVPADTPPPAPDAIMEHPESRTVTVPVKWVEAKRWNVSGNSFEIEADLGDIARKFGAGVYTIVIWAKTGNQSLAISNYTLFVP